MSTKNRKHSGRKRAKGELKMLNLRKFEKMLAMAGDDGHTIIPHVDPRYYPKIVPHHPKPIKKADPRRDAQKRAEKARQEELRGPGSAD